MTLRHAGNHRDLQGFATQIKPAGFDQHRCWHHHRAIFVVPNAIAQNLPSAPLTLALWLLRSGIDGRLLRLCGTRRPATGGQYVYLREAWGPLWGFLGGWTFFLAARSGANAAVTTGFAIYFLHFVPMSAVLSRVLASALILTLTLVNYRGIRLGAAVQNAFTSLKIIGLALLISVTLARGGHAVTKPPAQPWHFSMTQFSAGMMACLWPYNGWFA